MLPRKYSACVVCDNYNFRVRNKHVVAHRTGITIQYPVYKLYVIQYTLNYLYNCLSIITTLTLLYYNMACMLLIYSGVQYMLHKI